MKPSTSPFNPFKTKKIMQSCSKSTSLDEISESNPNTPEKPKQLRQRTSVAFSVNEVRKIAKELQKSDKEEPSSYTDLIRPSKQTLTKLGSGSSPNLVSRSLKKADESIKLPEKYEMLAKFFNSMECSIRLLQIKRKMTNFTNIIPGVESLTERRFSYKHLAQMKYILSEGIVLEKVLLHDEQTLCMKPDLQVTLQTNALKNGGERNEGSGFLGLRKIFYSRLLDFVKSHPEGGEVPEGTLPEPFNRTEQQIISNMNETCIPSLPIESSSDALPQQYSSAASHMSRCFQKRFVGRIPITELEKTQLLSAVTEPCFKETCSTQETLTSVPSLKCSLELPNIRIISTPRASPVKLPLSSPLAICDQETKPMKNTDCSPIKTNSTQKTPIKRISTPERLMTITPDLQTPKRCRISKDDDSHTSPNKLVNRPPRNRSLFNTPVKNAKAEDENENEMGRSSLNLEIIKLLPETLLQSIKEKEKSTIEKHDMNISQARKRRQIIACLPKLFNMIYLIFQSVKRCVITKEELMHKIIAGHCDIVDRSEVEEQLKLLQEIVPDCIWEVVSSSGDLLLCINKLSGPDSIQKRLAGAV